MLHPGPRNLFFTLVLLVAYLAVGHWAMTQVGWLREVGALWDRAFVWQMTRLHSEEVMFY